VAIGRGPPTGRDADDDAGDDGAGDEGVGVTDPAARGVDSSDGRVSAQTITAAISTARVQPAHRRDGGSSSAGSSPDRNSTLTAGRRRAERQGRADGAPVHRPP
jgi:hypothetical protein